VRRRSLSSTRTGSPTIHRYAAHLASTRCLEAKSRLEGLLPARLPGPAHRRHRIIHRNRVRVEHFTALAEFSVAASERSSSTRWSCRTASIRSPRGVVRRSAALTEREGQLRVGLSGPAGRLSGFANVRVPPRGACHALHQGATPRPVLSSQVSAAERRSERVAA